jgi:peptidoglycan hydrolase CwlO-like protein
MDNQTDPAPGTILVYTPQKPQPSLEEIQETLDAIQSSLEAQDEKLDALQDAITEQTLQIEEYAYAANRYPPVVPSDDE